MPGRSSGIRPKVIDLNLIPLELRHSIATTGTLLLLAAILTGGILLFLIDYVRVSTWDQTLDLDQQMRTVQAMIQTENKRIAAEKDELAKLNQEVKRLQDEMARPTTRVRRLISLAPAVDVVLASQSPALQLSTISWQEPKLTLQGRSSSLQVIMAYAERLRDSKRFTQVNLRQVATATSEITFALELEVAPEGGR